MTRGEHTSTDFIVAAGWAVGIGGRWGHDRHDDGQGYGDDEMRHGSLLLWRGLGATDRTRRTVLHFTECEH